MTITQSPTFVLTDDNFLRYAVKHYKNINCTDSTEFREDIQRFKYLKRLFNKYQETNDLKIRLILNHIIVLYNVFDTKATTTMLFSRLKGLEHYLKPFLVFLKYMPDQIHGVNEQPIYSTDIDMDAVIVRELRNI